LKLDDLKIADIIEPAHVAAYELEIGTIANEVTNFNANLYLMEKIFNFPWELITDVYGPFWEFVEKALFDGVILSIWKLCIDTEARGLTLSKLKNNINKDYIKKEFRNDLNDRIKAADYNAKLTAVQGVYTEIRHNYVAHFNFLKNANPTADELKARQLDLKTILDTRDFINSMYRVLSFDRYAYLPVQYYPDYINLAGGQQPTTDIENLLDLIAKNSEAVNMPERQPEYWEHFKESRSEEEIKILLAMRKKFGLSPA